MSGRPVISLRTLAELERVAGARLRREHRLDTDPTIYRDLVEIRRAALLWQLTHADASGIVVDTTPGGCSEMTTDEAAALAGITPNGIRWLIRHGRLKGDKRAGRYFVTREALGAYLDGRAKQ